MRGSARIAVEQHRVAERAVVAGAFAEHQEAAVGEPGHRLRPLIGAPVAASARAAPRRRRRGRRAGSARSCCDARTPPTARGRGSPSIRCRGSTCASPGRGRRRSGSMRTGSRPRPAGSAKRNRVPASLSAIDLAALDVERGEAAEARPNRCSAPSRRDRSRRRSAAGAGSLSSSGTGAKRRVATRGARRRRVGRRGDVGGERGEGEHQEGRALRPRPPNLFRKTPRIMNGA